MKKEAKRQRKKYKETKDNKRHRKKRQRDKKAARHKDKNIEIDTEGDKDRKCETN